MLSAGTFVQVYVSAPKKAVLDALELPSKSASLTTTDDRAARLHVVPLNDVSFKGMAGSHKHYAGRFDTVIAFRPTGWCMQSGTAGGPPHRITAWVT